MVIRVFAVCVRNDEETFEVNQLFSDPGWTGSDCSIDIDECRTIQPCKAAKSCINQPGSYQCECLESFTGQNCELVIKKNG